MGEGGKRGRVCGGGVGGGGGELLAPCLIQQPTDRPTDRPTVVKPSIWPAAGA